MGWLLAGCCGLTLVTFSVALKPVVITQKPRFYGVKTKYTVAIYCRSSDEQPAATVQWYKSDKYDGEHQSSREMVAGKRFGFLKAHTNSILVIHDVHLEDNGVYFCKLNNKTWGPGTALQVARPFNYDKAMHRTKLKDGLIILQGLLLAGCIAAVLLRKRQLQMKQKDSIYEEPETDHLYEGLAIETCEGGLYEELSVYAEAEVAEAPWE